jgi:hypothetical protein
LHDAIEYEKRGIPTCVVVTERFESTADLTAKMAGMPGYEYALIPHPISRVAAEVLKRRADAVAQRVIELLVERPGRSTVTPARGSRNTV